MSTPHEQIEESLEQFKGQSFTCISCGREGICDVDLKSAFTTIGQWTWLENGRYKPQWKQILCVGT